MISVVIPSYNGKNLLTKHLPAVIKACQATGQPWEIIVVDDASTDGTSSFLKKAFSQVKIVRLAQNQRFARACNAGVKAAKSELVILLNNDVSPAKDCFKKALPHFKDRSVFAVGFKEIEKKDGSTVAAGRALGSFQRGLLVHWRAKNQNKTTTLWAFGGSMIVRRSLWQKLGGFDPLFRPAYWEDIDLSWRAWKAGWQVRFEPEAVVYHQHETTNLQVFGRSRLKVYAFKNQLLFVWKNISDRRLLLSHFLWLPYHLAVTTIRTYGLFYLGFLLALAQLKEVFFSRRQALKTARLKDHDVLANLKD